MTEQQADQIIALLKQLTTRVDEIAKDLRTTNGLSAADALDHILLALGEMSPRIPDSYED
jgi:hypothetical protein